MLSKLKTSSQRRANEANAGMLDVTNERRMKQVIISFVRLVAGLRVRSREPHEHAAESDAGWKNCHSARFLLMAQSFYLICLPEGDNETRILKNHILLTFL